MATLYINNTINSDFNTSSVKSIFDTQFFAT